MAQFTDLPSKSTAASNDIVPIRDVTSNTDKKVTVDGLIAPGSITHAKLSTALGELGGPWQSWAITWSNLTVGNGVLGYALWNKIGRFTFFRLKFTFGSTTLVSGPISFSLPATAAGNQDIDFGGGYIDDAGVTSYPCFLNLSSPTDAVFIVSAAGGTYTTRAAVNANTPFTFGNTDALRAWGYYEAA